MMSGTVKKYFALEAAEKEADITIFGDITSWPWLESDVSAYMLSRQIADLDVDTINVHISSYGEKYRKGLRSTIPCGSTKQR